MADFWGGSWGSSWGLSWTGEDTPSRSDPGAGFGSTDRRSPKRRKRREQYLRRALAALEQQAKPEPTVRQPIAESVIEDAIETVEDYAPALIEWGRLPEVKYQVPDYLRVPKQAAQNRDMLVAAVALWMMQQAKIKAAEDEADEDMLLLAMM